MSTLSDAAAREYDRKRAMASSVHDRTRVVPLTSSLPPGIIAPRAPYNQLLQQNQTYKPLSMATPPSFLKDAGISNAMGHAYSSVLDRERQREEFSSIGPPTDKKKGSFIGDWIGLVIGATVIGSLLFFGRWWSKNNQASATDTTKSPLQSTPSSNGDANDASDPTMITTPQKHDRSTPTPTPNHSRIIPSMQAETIRYTSRTPETPARKNMAGFTDQSSSLPSTSPEDMNRAYRLLLHKKESDEKNAANAVRVLQRRLGEERKAKQDMERALILETMSADRERHDLADRTAKTLERQKAEYEKHIRDYQTKLAIHGEMTKEDETKSRRHHEDKDKHSRSEKTSLDKRSHKSSTRSEPIKTDRNHRSTDKDERSTEREERDRTSGRSDHRSGKSSSLSHTTSEIDKQHTRKSRDKSPTSIDHHDEGGRDSRESDEGRPRRSRDEDSSGHTTTKEKQASSKRPIVTDYNLLETANTSDNIHGETKMKEGHSHSPTILSPPPSVTSMDGSNLGMKNHVPSGAGSTIPSSMSPNLSLDSYGNISTANPWNIPSAAPVAGTAPVTASYGTTTAAPTNSGSVIANPMQLHPVMGSMPSIIHPTYGNMSTMNIGAPPVTPATASGAGAAIAGAASAASAVMHPSNNLTGIMSSANNMNTGNNVQTHAGNTSTVNMTATNPFANMWTAASVLRSHDGVSAYLR